MRFTIRDLLWLMVVVAMAAGWWMHYRQYEFWDRQGAMLDMQLRATGWNVTYSDNGLPVLVPPRDSASGISN
jgi:hypothetical protein